MTTEKIAVSVPSDVLAKARAAVRAGVAPSLSAYVSRAIEHQSMLEDLQKMLDEMLEESGGPLTPEEKRRIDRELLGSRRRKSR
ncbi:MAG: hypothetical protein HYV07_03705 [Deltaproteobacteria bacterium]|nr:hypothetical protein [Deltaproteobacteria bacterium]